jgi:ubiquitin-protein ligase
MPKSTGVSVPSTLTRRLLKDLAECQEYPYPNVLVHVDGVDISKICLIIAPENSQPLHLTVRFPHNYPLQPPKVTIQSDVRHPNVFARRVCVLQNGEGWTSAYTLKAVSIQILSLFSSVRIEQNYDSTIKLDHYRKDRAQLDLAIPEAEQYVCSTCGFGTPHAPQKSVAPPKQTPIQESKVKSNVGKKPLPPLPDELWLQIFSYLENSHLVKFSGAIPAIKAKMSSYDFIRKQELQCFCSKKSFRDTTLGIGVSIDLKEKDLFRSEFDLLSEEAFTNYKVRTSVQGVEFSHWLPLPLSSRHWNLVRPDIGRRVNALHQAANMGNADRVSVLYSFMNNIVIHFSAVGSSNTRPDATSTLTHASEKAVEAYFALFHLLLCVAIERPEVVRSANQLIADFIRGPQTKNEFPNLGHLLVASLISDTGLTSELTETVVHEAILRNVVWMLGSYPELAYIEPNASSNYRLQKTFEASRTSYHLLMFMKLFSSTARGDAHDKTLTPDQIRLELRNKLFQSHGAPSPSASTSIARKTRQIRTINNFSDFLMNMGIAAPTKEGFCGFLKKTISESVEKGYSKMPLSQGQAYLLRREKEDGIGKAEGAGFTR